MQKKSISEFPPLGSSPIEPTPKEKNIRDHSPESKLKKNKYKKIDRAELSKHVGFMRTPSPKRKTFTNYEEALGTTPDHPKNSYQKNTYRNHNNYQNPFNNSINPHNKEGFYNPSGGYKTYNRNFQNENYRNSRNSEYVNRENRFENQMKKSSEVIFQKKSQRSISRTRNEGSVDSKSENVKSKQIKFEEEYYKLGNLASDDEKIFEKLKEFLSDLHENIPEYKAHVEKIDAIEKDIIMSKQNVAKNEHDREKRKALSEKKKEFEAQKHIFEAFIKSCKARVKELEELYKHVTKKTSLDYKKRQFALANLLRSISVEIFRIKSALPIYAKKLEFMEHVADNIVTLLVAETGSGKSTQIPQYLLEIAGDKMILVIEPRKLATINLAQRIKEEIQNPRIVDYVTSTESKFNAKSRIRFITDRVLLNEAINNFDFSKYYCIFVDEAHERNVNTDVLLGLLKKAIAANDKLKIVVTSATLDQDLFRPYFNCSVFQVPGRLYPVNIKYISSIDDYNNYSSAIYRLIDYKIEKKLKTSKPSKFDGNILIFTAGIDEINRLTREFKPFSTHYRIVPLHGRLTPSEQQSVFKKSDERKIILATRIAETAITIENVTVVIDTGYDREVIYDPVKRMSLMEMTTISQSSAKQRAGRAGRTTPGVCYRLYTENEFENFPKFKIPEIKRSNLDHIILKLKKFKIEKISDFDFIENPDTVALNEAIDTLMMLECLDSKEKMTKLGDIICTMPTDPTISRILYEGVINDVEEEVSKIVSLINNSANLFYRGETADKQHIADLKKFGFIDETGDLMTYLNVFMKYEDQLYANRIKATEWATKNRINLKALNEALDTYEEIRPSIRKMKELLGKKVEVQKPEEKDLGPISEIDPQLEDENANLVNMDDDIEIGFQENLKKEEKAITLEVDGKKAKILKCFLIGYFQNICYYSGNPNLGYTLLRDMKNIKIHGSSALALQGKLNYQWVICTDISKAKYVHTKIISAIDESWIEKMIPKSYLEKFKIKSLKENPVYQSLIFKDVSTAIIYQFIEGMGQKVQKMIDEHNIFFDGNRDQLILEAWTTDPDVKKIEAKIRNHIDIYKETYSKETLERKYEGMTVSVIESGARVREFLLRNETRQFMFKRQGFNSLEKYQSLFSGFDKLIESMIVVPDMKSVKIKCHSKKDIKVFRDEFKFLPDDKLNLLYSDCIANKEVLSLVDVIWYIGASQRTGFVKFHRVEDAFDVRRHFNHTVLGKKYDEEGKEIDPGSQIYCKIKDIRPQNVIIHNLPSDMDEFDLVKELKSRGFNGTILHTHIYRETNDEYFDLIDEENNAIYEANLRSVVEKHLESKEALAKVEVAPKLPPGDFNEYKRKATLVFKNIHDAQKIKSLLDGKTGIIGTMKMYCLPAYHKKYELRREDYLPVRDLYFAAENEFKNRFGESVKFENSFENTDFRKKIERQHKIRYNQDMKFVIIKIKADHAFQMNEVVKKLNSFFLPKKFVLRTKDSNDILYNYEHLDKLKKDLRISVFPSTRDDEIKIYAENRVYEIFCKRLLDYLDNPIYKTETIKFRGKCITSLMKNDLFNFNVIKNAYKDVRINLSLAYREITVNGKAQRVDEVVLELNKHITDQRIGGLEYQNCSLCLAPITKIFSLLNCGHKYCNSCLRNYCIESIDLINPSREFKGICCPEVSCLKPIFIADLKTLIGYTFLDKLTKAAVQQSLYYFPKIKRCPTPDCPQIFADPEGEHDKDFECEICSVTYCKICRQASHPGKNCEEAKDERDMLDPETRKRFEIKQCPKCKRDIQKKDGCPHMQCPCKNHFCWICLKSYDDWTKANTHVMRRHTDPVVSESSDQEEGGQGNEEFEDDDLAVGEEDDWFEA